MRDKIVVVRNRRPRLRRNGKRPNIEELFHVQDPPCILRPWRVTGRSLHIAGFSRRVKILDDIIQRRLAADGTEKPKRSIIVPITKRGKYTVKRVAMALCLLEFP